MTTADVIRYYQALLILQYRSVDKALAHVGAYVAIFLQNQITQAVADAFALASAIGKQLNIMGVYRGVSRVVFGIEPAEYWSLVPYDDTLPDLYHGWAEYPDADPTWQWLEYDDLNRVAYTLNDTQMRLAISFKAQVDAWDGTLGKLDEILYAFFGTYVTVVDNENMSIIYRHQAADPDPNNLWSIIVTAGFLPSNAGVSFTVEEV